jgi:membrane protein insertase Oxa1/YidC/SpoIIIJ
MLRNHGRNPLLIFVFTIIGSSIRYIFFYVLDKIKGEKPKSFYAFSDGFKQIVYNLLFILILIFAGVFLLAYVSLRG